MNFTKMQGLGNDFILMEADSFEEAGRFQVYARQLCDRHWGIGADGLILLARIRNRIFSCVYIILMVPKLRCAAMESDVWLCMPAGMVWWIKIVFGFGPWPVSAVPKY